MASESNFKVANNKICLTALLYYDKGCRYQYAIHITSMTQKSQKFDTMVAYWAFISISYSGHQFDTGVQGQCHLNLKSVNKRTAASFLTL